MALPALLLYTYADADTSLSFAAKPDAARFSLRLRQRCRLRYYKADTLFRAQRLPLDAAAFAFHASCCLRHTPMPLQYNRSSNATMVNTSCLSRAATPLLMLLQQRFFSLSPWRRCHADVFATADAAMLMLLTLAAATFSPMLMAARYAIAFAFSLTPYRRRHATTPVLLLRLRPDDGYAADTLSMLPTAAADAEATAITLPFSLCYFTPCRFAAMPDA